MAIYSLNLRSIGRSTQKVPFTAAAALRYIGRKTACSEMIGEHFPSCGPGDTKAAEAWLREQETSDRSNARVADRIIIALPVELDNAGQAATVHEFMRRLGDGRVPWIGGLHNHTKDAHNPHAHLLVRDRDITTGKRVINLSEQHAAVRVRQLWATVCNEALRAAGVATRIDHRSNKDRGLEEIPGVHVGQKLTHMSNRPKEEETRMTINAKIGAANTAIATARTIADDAHDMAIDVARVLAEERAARLNAEAALEAERNRHKIAESKLQQAIQSLHEQMERMRLDLEELVEEARDYVRALLTRVLPSQTKPQWLNDRAWGVYLTVMRFGPPKPNNTGGIERSGTPLPQIPRRDQQR